jgi:bifunctional DNA-binding transcriptional regulator/antitoxin component of YhaV-PrlF toxin-antitoxin module
MSKNTYHVKVNPQGRISLPVELRRAMQIEIGESVVLQLDGPSVKLKSMRQAVRDVQDLVAQYDPEGKLSVDNFLAERREEAKREEEKWGNK